MTIPCLQRLAVLSVCSLVTLASLAGAAPPPSAWSNTWSSAGASVIATASTFPGGQKVIGFTGRLTTLNTSLRCPSATAAVGVAYCESISTGAYVWVPGVGARGDFTITGGDGVSRTGTGTTMLAALSGYDPNTGEVTWAASSLAAFSVPMGSTMPADQASAEAMVDQAFGPAARRGQALNQMVHKRRTGTPIAFYARITTTMTNPNGTVTKVAGSVGVGTFKGQVKAVIGVGSSKYYHTLD